MAWCNFVWVFWEGKGENGELIQWFEWYVGKKLARNHEKERLAVVGKAPFFRLVAFTVLREEKAWRVKCTFGVKVLFDIRAC